MIYCFDKKLTFDYSKIEMAICKENGNGILYDEQNKKFTDFDGNEVDIKGLTIFPRTGVLQLYAMLEEIKRQGGIPNVSEEETTKIEMWPKYYKTKRKMRVLKGKELQDPKIIDEIEKEFGSNIFIKTVKKGFNSVIPISLLRDKECVFYKGLEHHPDEDFMVSEEVKLKEDQYGKKEYRCFVVNNEPYNISRFTTDIFHEVDEDVLRALHGVIENAKDSLPSTYAVDLLEYERDGERIIDVSEFNPPQAAGLYLYNSILEPSSDILHKKDMKRISKEFLQNLDECSMEGKVINGRNSLYEIPGSFANDLRSIFIIGDVGVTFVADIPFNSSCFSAHKGVFSFESNSEDSYLSPMSDSDLTDGIEEKPKIYKKEENNDN